MITSRNILIVEDEPLIAMMLEDFLESLGHRSSAPVDSVEAALDHVGRGGFDVAIVDVQLKDGKQAWPVADRSPRPAPPSSSPPAAMSSRRPKPTPTPPSSPSPTRSTRSSRRWRRRVGGELSRCRLALYSR